MTEEDHEFVQFVNTIVIHSHFERFIMLVIILNTVTLCVVWQGMPDWLTDITEYFNLFFFIVFCVEATHHFRAYIPHSIILTSTLTSTLTVTLSLTLSLVQAFLKLIAYGIFEYFLHAWNQFDFLCIFFAVLGSSKTNPNINTITLTLLLVLY